MFAGNASRLDKNAIYTTEAGTARYIRGLLKGLRELNPPDLEILEVLGQLKTYHFGSLNGL